MAAPHSSRYPRPLRATHAFSPSPSGASQQAKRRPSLPPAAGSSSQAAPAGKRANLPLSPDLPSAATSERVGVIVSLENEDDELDSRRRASSLTSLSDPVCCYSNSLWQRGPPTNQPLVDGAESPLGGEEEREVSEALFHGFSHKRSSSCSSADTLKTSPPVVAPARRSDAVHTRKSIEGLNQEITSALEGVQILSPHHPPDGHMAPIRELLSSIPHSSPQYTLHSSPSSLPCSPHPRSTPSPSALSTPTELPDTPTGFPLPPSSSLYNPSFAREPPDGIERCLTAERKPATCPDKTKGNIVFQGSAFLPTCRTVTVNSVS